MLLSEVSERVDFIRAIAGDHEAAHSAQDDLYRSVLAAIADGAENARDLAAVALAVEAIEFHRWYA
jgi:hypothetical protein